jgi:hypothetical protein
LLYEYKNAVSAVFSCCRYEKYLSCVVYRMSVCITLSTFRWGPWAKWRNDNLSDWLTRPLINKTTERETILNWVDIIQKPNIFIQNHVFDNGICLHPQVRSVFWLEIRISSIDWAQQGRLLTSGRKKSSLRNVVLNKNWNDIINILSSWSLRTDVNIYYQS